MRIFKILKVFKYNRKFNQWFGVFNMSATTKKMVLILISMLLMVHLISCFWYLSAKFSVEYVPDEATGATIAVYDADTWLGRMPQHQDESDTLKYFLCVYWAFQILTTVGYGDIGSKTTAEYILFLFWVIIGIAFYQIAFGQIISIIQQHASGANILDQKIKALEDFQKESNLDDDLYHNIRQFMINNFMDLFIKVDEEDLLNELPASLREEVLYRQYGSMVETIEILRVSSDNEFVWTIIQIASKINFENGDTIYYEDDFSEDFFMLFQGRV